MALIRVFGNTYLDPNLVGLVRMNVDFSGGEKFHDKRVNTTEIIHKDGNTVMAVLKTTVSINGSDTTEAAIDNHHHKEVLTAINAKGNARTYEEFKSGVPITPPSTI